MRTGDVGNRLRLGLLFPPIVAAAALAVACDVVAQLVGQCLRSLELGDVGAHANEPRPRVEIAHQSRTTRLFGSWHWFNLQVLIECKSIETTVKLAAFISLEHGHVEL